MPDCNCRWREPLRRKLTKRYLRHIGQRAIVKWSGVSVWGQQISKVYREEDLPVRELLFSKIVATLRRYCIDLATINSIQRERMRDRIEESLKMGLEA